MKTSLHCFYCAIAVFAMLSGCATPGGSAKPKSEALQIAQAAGMKNIRDVSSEEYSDAVRARSELAGSTAVETIAVGTGIFTPTTGWNVGGQTTFLGVMTLLTALPTYVPENDHRFLVWMPLDEAETPEAASIHMRDTIVSSFREALQGYDVALKKRYFTGSGAGERWYIAIDGPRCKGCEMWSLTFFNNMPKPKVRKAPGFIGSEEAYVWSVDGWRNSNFSGFPEKSLGEESLSANERMNMFTKISANLPTWVYLYIAPRDDLTGFPLILHQGKPMFFFEPDS